MEKRWIPGNDFTLLENGEGFFPRVFESIGAAEHEVLLETFIVFDDKVGRELQQALRECSGHVALRDLSRRLLYAAKMNGRIPGASPWTQHTRSSSNSTRLSRRYFDSSTKAPPEPSVPS